MHFSPGEHFTHSTLEEDDVGFVAVHRDAWYLLAEVRPGYGDRRLGSQPLIKKANDEVIKSLFVETCGDREAFSNVCVKELEKGNN